MNGWKTPWKMQNWTLIRRVITNRKKEENYSLKIDARRIIKIRKRKEKRRREKMKTKWIWIS